MADLWVRRRVLDCLSSLRGRPWEVGGWLLGYRDGDTMVLTHATPPASPGTPFGITISSEGHRAAFDALWEATAGRVTFLGDWHSHPRGRGHPSQRDEQAVRQLAEDPDFKTPRPLIGITLTGQLPRGRYRLPVFFLGDRNGSLRRLKARPFDGLHDSVVKAG